MTTNLLAMPLVNMQVITGTNEDWVDSIKFVVDDGSGDPPQLDLTGIKFDMEVRRQPPDNEVVLRASTDDGTLAVGEAPNFGFLLINISHEQMKIIKPDSYTADIVGTDGDVIRRCIVIDLEIALGITRP
jgi:hypothetical protein